MTSSALEDGMPAGRPSLVGQTEHRRSKAKPPARSCRQAVSPSARQSPNMPRMWAATSSSPVWSSQG